jgi:hypothetical protein
VGFSGTTVGDATVWVVTSFALPHARLTIMTNIAKNKKGLSTFLIIYFSSFAYFL